MPRVIRDAAWAAFDDALTDDPSAVRIKHERAGALAPGGRCRLTLFEEATPDGRPHPRLRVEQPPVADPAPVERWLPEPPADLDGPGFRAWLASAVADIDWLRGLDERPVASPRFWENSMRTQRQQALFTEARGLVAALPPSERIAGLAAVAELHDLAAVGPMQFDDEDTGTYHSYGEDAPFVHFLERMIAALPPEASDALALLPEAQREAVRRQRRQARAWLDHLMRRKYAHAGVHEADIERSVGGRLIDRVRRQVVSIDPDSDPVQPAYELLRVDPAADHPLAGAWVYRDGDALFHDGTPVEGAPTVRRIPVAAEALTFERAPGDPRLRADVPLDWDGDGWVAAEPIAWVEWAGHCDLKAVQEAVGLTLLDDPDLTEHRSDTGDTSRFGRDLLLEMLTAGMELGSAYRHLDGSRPTVQRGVHRFGGARNDSLPDRLQLYGAGEGRHVRWPLSGRAEDFRVTALWDDGARLEPREAFSRHTVDTDGPSFRDNTRFQKFVEGDYALIDASGLLVDARVRVAAFDPDTGRPTASHRKTRIDLRPDGDGPERCFLGATLWKTGTRQILTAWLDRRSPAFVGEVSRAELRDGRWVMVRVPDADVTVPLVAPLHATLSREAKQEDPALFTALLERSLRRGEPICADTDAEAPVWNGVVTRLDVDRVARSDAEHTEHWRVDVTARFGEARLEYLVRRRPDGTPEAYATVPVDEAVDFVWQSLPDVAAKGRHEGAWIVNDTMVERGIVTVEPAPWNEGGAYVHDDHVKNVFEIVWAALAGYRHTIVHQNKRYGFRDADAWQAAVDRLTALREAVQTTAGGPTLS